MFTRTLMSGTRRSPLALRRADEVIGRLKEFYPGINIEIIGIDTYGDTDNILTPYPLRGALALEAGQDDLKLRSISEVLNGR